MAQGSTELDRLIEEGLTLYGQGDLDGALLIWEQVLSVDPENAQANSYVDYVRDNYELLTSDLGDERSRPNPAETELATGSDAAMTLELEADEPEISITEHEVEEEDEEGGPQNGAVNFDDATREYESAGSRSREQAEFSPEATPGFGANQATDVRRRDLGFVKPTAAATVDIELPTPPRKRPPTAQPPELQMTLRTPQHGDEIETADLSPPRPGDAPAPSSPFEQSYAAHEIELPTGKSGALSARDEDDLISSLPSPRAAHVTRDLPTDIVPPHQKAALDAIELDVPIDPPPPLGGAPTREMTMAFAISATQTQDFSDKPTQQVDRPATLKTPDPLVSAPTRELGLRTTSVGVPVGMTGRTPTEDQPTLTGAKIVPRAPERDPEGTRGDIVLPFDPIDARTAKILEEVDATAPAGESREDKTRRRISALIDQAQIWAATGDLDRGVAAIDLALSEDPNSALAQKLIHRNRDTIMAVFQGFLGNLERQPMLARPLHELGSAPISPRAAFLLSRVDGNLSLDEILDVSGMPRLEAYRYLCQLFLRGILR